MWLPPELSKIFCGRGASALTVWVRTLPVPFTALEELDLDVMYYYRSSEHEESLEWLII